MQSEIDETNLLRSSIARFSAENDKIRAENTELKARIAKLEDKRFFLFRFEKIYVLSRDTIPLRGMSRNP